MDNRFLGLIERSMKEHWDLPAFSDYNGHTFHFKDVARRIEKFHILLEHAGIKKGDKVAIVGRNSSNWAICFFGILAYGAVAVPILHEFKPDNIHHIVNHSGAKAVLAGSSNWENLNEKMMPEVKLFMMLDNFSIIDCKNKEVRTVRNRINEYFGKKYPRSFTANDVKYHVEDPEELAVLNYTSGTTSFSKGVMIPYRSLWSNTQFAYDRLPFIHPGDNIVCMLPMAHMYGLAFEVLNSVNKGCHVHFLTRTPSPKIIAEAFATVRPALILAVPLIIEHGAAWFRQVGTAGSPGTKAFALTGNVVNTGLIEVPMGTTLREIIFDIGGGIKDGKKFKAVQIGGPSGGCLTEEHLDLPLDYDSLKHVGAIMGSGGLVVMDEDTCMAEVARFFMKFTQKESCGKCIPCREGTKRMLEALERIVGNEGSEEDIELLEDLSDTISHTALCGLGQSACKPVQSTLRYFREDYERHVRDKFCPLCNGKPKVLQIDPEKCKGCSLCARNCPVEAITGEVKKPFVIDTEKCIRCNACVKNCKFGAIREV